MGYNGGTYMNKLSKQIFILLMVSAGFIYSADHKESEEAADKSFFGIKINGYKVAPASGSIQFNKNGIKRVDYKNLKLSERLVFPASLGDEVVLFFMQGHGAVQEKIKVQKGIMCEICKPEGQVYKPFKVENGIMHVKAVPICKEGFQAGEFACIKKVPLIV